MIQAMTTKFRTEKKHIIRKDEELALARRLRRLFSLDKNAGPDGTYRVTSLYFDNFYNTAYQEKEAGLSLRHKYRLRYYNDDLSYIRLEKKSKVGARSQKTSTLLSLVEVKKLLKGDFDFLLGKNSPARDLYFEMKNKILRPSYLVAYDRMAFVYEPANTRMTIDKNIRTSTAGVRDFLDPRKKLFRIGHGRSIFEVKYDKFLPDIVRMASQLEDGQTTSFSKYSATRLF